MNWDWDKLQEQKRRQGPQPPDFGRVGDEFKRLVDIKNRLPGGPKIIALAVALLWLASGIYIVEPDETGVVQRFGAYAYTTGPGPHYHLPYPIETVQTPKVSQVRRIEVGFRTLGGREGQGQQYRDVPEESLMLTGDENIVDVQFIVQYQINDPVKYLFRLDRPDETLKSAAEAAMREVIGNDKIDSALTDGKVNIQAATMTLLQQMMDRYDSGIDVVAVQLQDVHPPRDVIDAFKDVASAREDRVRLVNEAEAYRNDILPKARGQAAALENQAMAYKDQAVLKARGEAARFSALAAEYAKAPEVTRERLYLEAMETILRNPTLDKIILSDEALRQAVPYLPLDQGARRAPRDEAGAGKTPRQEGGN
ncbi:MAG: FtsH protease activity modulator HflK [Thermodesulfobacteriota bacterium]